MHIDQFGRTFVSENELFHLIYSGNLLSVDNIYLNDESVVDQYNKSIDINFDNLKKLNQSLNLNINIHEFDKINQKKWFIPNDFNIDIIEYIYTQCHTNEQKDRVTQELELYKKYNMIDLLTYLKFLVDTMKSNNIVWGVGRGSSVASYILFLLEVHKIDSLKYSLDIHEFLK